MKLTPPPKRSTAEPVEDASKDLIKTKKRKLGRMSREHLDAVLSEDPHYAKRLSYDELRQNILLDGETLTQDGLHALAVAVLARYRAAEISVEVLAETVQSVAKRNKFNVVRRYLQTLLSKRTEILSGDVREVSLSTENGETLVDTGGTKMVIDAGRFLVQPGVPPGGLANVPLGPGLPTQADVLTADSTELVNPSVLAPDVLPRNEVVPVVALTPRLDTLGSSDHDSPLPRATTPGLAGLDTVCDGAHDAAHPGPAGDLGAARGATARTGVLAPHVNGGLLDTGLNGTREGDTINENPSLVGVVPVVHPPPLAQLTLTPIERLPFLFGVHPNDPLLKLYQRYCCCFFVGAVARALQPGVKNDLVFVLQGPQGYGKSTFFRTMAEAAGPDLFQDSAYGFSRDAIMSMNRHWILEWAEIDELLEKASSGKVKAFLSCQTDEYRAPYARLPEAHPRHFVLAATTNESAILKDPTGSRRFAVVPCSRPIATAEVLLLRDQVWLDAYSRYLSNETWWLSDDDAARQVEANRAVEIADDSEVMEAALADRFPQEVLRVDAGEARRTLGEICLELHIRSDNVLFSRSMHALGFSKRRSNAKRWWERKL